VNLIFTDRAFAGLPVAEGCRVFAAAMSPVLLG
jgi:hypothetical protein